MNVEQKKKKAAPNVLVVIFGLSVYSLFNCYLFIYYFYINVREFASYTIIIHIPGIIRRQSNEDASVRGLHIGMFFVC